METLEKSEYWSGILINSGNLLDADEQTLRCVNMLRSVIGIALVDALNGDVDAIRWIGNRENTLHSFNNLCELASIKPEETRKILTDKDALSKINSILGKKDAFKLDKIIRNVLPKDD